MNPRDREAVGYILECIAAIDRYVARADGEWTDDDMTVDAISKRIEEIGEVAKKLSGPTIDAMPGVYWKGVRGMREVLAHDYDAVRIDIVADTVMNDLPGLREAAAAVLDDDEKGPA